MANGDCVKTLPTVAEDAEDDDDISFPGPSPGPGWNEKLEKAKSYKAEGNEKYKTGAIKAAIGKYHRAILYLKGIEDAQQSVPFVKEHKRTELLRKVPEEALPVIMKLKMDTYNNLAACILLSENPAYEKVVKYCNCVLEISVNNVKGLYRKGVALYHLKDIDGALQALQLAAKSQPDGTKDANVCRYLKLCERDMSVQDDKMKQTYRNMFGPSGSDGPQISGQAANLQTRTRKETEPPLSTLNEAESFPTGDAGRRYTT